VAPRTEGDRAELQTGEGARWFWGGSHSPCGALRFARTSARRLRARACLTRHAKL